MPVCSWSSTGIGTVFPSASRYVSLQVITPPASSAPAVNCVCPVRSRWYSASSVEINEPIAHRWSMNPRRCHIGRLPSPAPATSHPHDDWNSWS